MKIVYCCFSGKDAALVAGKIHLGFLPEDRVPTLAELTQCHGADCLGHLSQGTPGFLGVDPQQNEVYTLGVGKDRTICLQAICHVLFRCANYSEWQFIDAWNQEHALTRWGRFCSSKLRWARVGCWLQAIGIQRSYVEMVQQVRQVKGRDGSGKT